MKSGNVAKSLEIFLSCKIPKSDMVFINKFHLTKFKLVTYFGSIHDPNMCRVSVLGLMFPGGQVRIKGLAQGRGGPHILDDFSPFLAHPKSMGGGRPYPPPLLNTLLPGVFNGCLGFGTTVLGVEESIISSLVLNGNYLFCDHPGYSISPDIKNVPIHFIIHLFIPTWGV